jgi:hypothetical protein
VISFLPALRKKEIDIKFNKSRISFINEQQNKKKTKENITENACIHINNVFELYEKQQQQNKSDYQYHGPWMIFFSFFIFIDNL